MLLSYLSENAVCESAGKSYLTNAGDKLRSASASTAANCIRLKLVMQVSLAQDPKTIRRRGGVHNELEKGKTSPTSPWQSPMAVPELASLSHISTCSLV